jgi:hypothetical protein
MMNERQHRIVRGQVRLASMGIVFASLVFASGFVLAMCSDPRFVHGQDLRRGLVEGAGLITPIETVRLRPPQPTRARARERRASMKGYGNQYPMAAQVQGLQATRDLTPEEQARSVDLERHCRSRDRTQQIFHTLCSVTDGEQMERVEAQLRGLLRETL